VAERSATLLSGGQQQRVALARAIAVNSRMLLMDEPLSNLDARLREDVRGRIRDLAKQLGSTVVYVTHDQVEAMAMADRIALMSMGQLLQVGTPLELYRHPREPFIAEFFGQVNWLDGVTRGGGSVETPLGQLRIDAAAPAGHRMLLGIRPESLVPAERDATNAIEARVISSTFLGDQVHGQLGIAGRVLVAKGRALLVAPGSIVNLAIDPAEIMLFPDGTPPDFANAIQPLVAAPV
jgi:ABC-type sugar transport system ATPase subunit